VSQTSDASAAATYDFPQTFGHPRPLWMLFMTEFWERFAFYTVSWALALYIVQQFWRGDHAGEAWASAIFGGYTALVYATGIFGGYVADKLIGYQRSILLGAVVMAVGLFTLMLPSKTAMLIGLSLEVVGNGLFKPNISSMVGQLYPPGDARRDRGFTLFYMGINAGSFLAPLVTGWLAVHFGGATEQNFKLVFAAAGTGMLLSLVWFWFGRRGLHGIGRPPAGGESRSRVLYVAVGALAAVPVMYFLLSTVGAVGLQWLLAALFLIVAFMLIREAVHGGKVAVERIVAMLVIVAFNVLFWMFYYQLGTSFNFLAANMVDRQFANGWLFPVGWFQSVNPLTIVVAAPLISLLWGALSKRNREPSIPRKFGFGLVLNGFGFLALMYALKYELDAHGLIPFWPLPMCYVMQTLGELCLSPIGLSMITKLAPPKVVGLAMGEWFLATAVGGNLSGLLAAHISGESGMTAASALSGFTFSFWVLAGAGALLLLLSPLINRFMHGVK
jgi:proton-dependent oligopeptide transporter, POT family